MPRKRPHQLLYRFIVVILLMTTSMVIARSLGWIGIAKKVKVKIAQAYRTNIEATIEAYGYVYPEKEVIIRSALPGEVTNLYVRENELVAEGAQLLAIGVDRLHSQWQQAQAVAQQHNALWAEAQAQTLKAAAIFRKTEASFQRNQKLYLQGVIADAAWEQVVAIYAKAKQDWKSASQHMLSAKYTVTEATVAAQQVAQEIQLAQILAPMAGTVVDVMVKAGEHVAATGTREGTLLMRIADLNRMEVQVNVSENDMTQINIGDAAIIQLAAYPKQLFKGIVTYIASKAHPKPYREASTEFEVHTLLLPSEDSTTRQNNTYTYGIPLIRMGMNATVEIVTQQRNNTLAVPLLAATTRARLPTDAVADSLDEVVFVYANGKVTKRKVTLGINNQDHIEVLSGLQEGETIVAGPYQIVFKQLQDNMRVEVVDD